MKNVNKIPKWIDELYYTSMIFGELLSYHAADDRFEGLVLPPEVYVEKWSMFWFSTETARHRFAQIVQSGGFDVILAEDTIMDHIGNHVVLTDFPELNLRDYF